MTCISCEVLCCEGKLISCNIILSTARLCWILGRRNGHERAWDARQTVTEVGSAMFGSVSIILVRCLWPPLHIRAPRSCFPANLLLLPLCSDDSASRFVFYCCVSRCSSGLRQVSYNAVCNGNNVCWMLGACRAINIFAYTCVYRSVYVWICLLPFIYCLSICPSLFILHHLRSGLKPRLI